MARPSVPRPFAMSEFDRMFDGGFDGMFDGGFDGMFDGGFNGMFDGGFDRMFGLQPALVCSCADCSAMRRAQVYTYTYGPYAYSQCSYGPI